MVRFGIGTDIESVNRFSELVEHKDPVIRRIFSPDEIRYCLAYDSPGQRFAARFAGKEAVIKALFDIGMAGVAIPEVTIQNRDNGAPFVRVNRIPADHMNIRVSLSHTWEWAIAFALVVVDTDDAIR